LHLCITKKIEIMRNPLNNQVTDSRDLLEFKEEISKKVAKYLEKAMFNAGAIWCKTVPLNSEAAIVDYWTH